MRVREILEHFLSRADWIERETTVDRVIVGDAETDVDCCLVTWMPSFSALRRVVERGMRLLVCHEPTFWRHRADHATESPESQAKLAYIRDHELVILRNHDCWDKWPGTGIPWAWAGFLGLGNRPRIISTDRCHHRYDIEPVALEAFARHVAGRCERLGEPLVQVTGDASQMVSGIGVGTGCGCDIPTYQAMGCDCSIVCDDGSSYWADVQRAEDLSHPVIRVNHGTSEEPGMVTLTAYINANIDGVRAEHLAHKCTFRLVGADAAPSQDVRPVT
jgi:putative NIF3 family GTP cyclohydrolase 1 type 2